MLGKTLSVAALLCAPAIANAQSVGNAPGFETGPDLTPGSTSYDDHRWDRPYLFASGPQSERLRALLQSGDADAILTYLGALATEGESWAMMELGALYAEGTLVEADPVASLNWFGMAAMAGEARAALVLGAMYTRGTVITPDPEKAAYWLDQAVQLGDYQIERDVKKILAKR